MRELRKKSLTVLVWLTAAMTLAAGTPHFNCRCPNGRVKAFCFGSAVAKHGCCDGSCCDAKAAGASGPQAASASCCGQHHKPAPNVPARTEGWLTGSHCTKTFVQPTVSTIQSPQKPILKDATLSVLLAFQSPLIWAAPMEPCRSRQKYQRPPPTDLVIALQHFLI